LKTHRANNKLEIGGNFYIKTPASHSRKGRGDEGTSSAGTLTAEKRKGGVCKAGNPTG